MRFLPMLAALLGLGALWPALAWAQTADAPPDSSHYTTAPPTPLDKNYGLPTFGMPGSELPQQRTMAPVARPAEQPDFFKPMPRLNEAVAPESTEQDFFTGGSDTPLPKTRSASRDARTGDDTTRDDTTMETPLFTTSQPDATTDSTTGEMTTGRFGTGD
jgi:hypothetical protein